MSLFLTIYVFVYGGMNAYLFIKARGAFALGTRSSVALGLFMLFMIAAPILVRLVEHNSGDASLARVLAWVGYTWFGLVFPFFASGFMVEPAVLIARKLGLATAGGQRAVFVAQAAVIVAVYAYGLYEATHLRVEHLRIETAKLTEGPVRVVQVSDIHLGLLVGRGRLQDIVETVQAERPDMIVCTGDLMDGLTTDAHELWGMFAALTPPMGKYAVLGNHEYYAGLDYSVRFIGQSGFRLLRDEAADAGRGVRVVGVDFRESRRMMGLTAPLDEAALLGEPGGDGFTLLLKHAPVVEAASLGRFDLMLSGHTHKGQIYPFQHIVKLVYPYLAGLYDLGQGSALYVNRGTATWGPPIRVFSPPEVTVIDLVPAGAPGGG
jgi:hypothetical protein